MATPERFLWRLEEALTPGELHRKNIEAGFDSDPAQLAVVERLDALQRRLARDASSRWGLGRLLARRRPPVRGMYLWGSVGRGKTYLMDILHESVPGDRLRLHFHRFMQRVHAELGGLAGKSDPLRDVADRIAAEARLLCFDEFFVSDIGDAMILAELLSHLFERRVTLVATSNVEPSRLYENGLQRRRFLPAIRLIERHCDVVAMEGELDFRLRVLRRSEIYRTATDEAGLERSFRELCPGLAEHDARLQINGRSILARRRGEDVVWFEFAEICDGPRSQNDYIELAREFHAVVVSGIPVFTPAKEGQARRFISLVDEFYDRNVKMLFSAHAPVERLYQGERLGFEFQRTESRIVEMQGEEYLSRTHKA